MRSLMFPRKASRVRGLVALLCLGWLLSAAAVRAAPPCFTVEAARKNAEELANSIEKYLVAGRRGRVDRGHQDTVLRKSGILLQAIDRVEVEQVTSLDAQRKSALQAFRGLADRVVTFKANPGAITNPQQFRDEFLADWRDFLASSETLGVGEYFTKSLLSSQRSFSAILDGMAPESLIGLAISYEELAPVSNSELFANHHIATAARAKYALVLDQLPPAGDSVVTALARAKVRLGSLGLDTAYTTTPYENPGPDGPPYNPGAVSERIESLDPAYQWGRVDRGGGHNVRITITDAAGYVDWLDATHYGGLDPFLRQQILVTAESMAIEYQIGDLSGGGPIPILNSVPGTHAEIFAFNDALRWIRQQDQQLQLGLFSVTDPAAFRTVDVEDAVLGSITISTFDFSARSRVERHANSFRACVHCQAIIPDRVTVFSGVKEEEEYIPGAP
jgi:hypothetical protein